MKVAPSPAIHFNCLEDVEEGKRSSHSTHDSHIYPTLATSTSSLINTRAKRSVPSLKNLEYNRLLQFKNDGDAKEYIEFTKTQFYPLVVRIYVFLFLIVLVLRVDWNGFTSGPLAVMTILGYLTTTALFSIFFIGRHFQTLFGRELSKPIQRAFEYFIIDILHDELESIVTFIGSMSCLMELINTTIIGACVADSSMFSNCNLLAESNSPPLSIIAVLFLYPISFQIFVKNVRKSVLALNWVLSVAAIIWCLWYIGSFSQYWVLVYGVFSALLSYEYERIQMSSFLTTKRLLKNENDILIDILNQNAENESLLKQIHDIKLVEEKNRVDLEILEMNTKNEAKLKESESFQLRSLMGNVAHDLKTPIHSVVMDIDILKDTYLDAIKLFPDFHAFMIKDDIKNPLIIIESVEATCKFMTMGVNKCIEYTKCSSGHALKPTMVTFELNSAIVTPYRCIVHHLHANDRDRIVVHPIDSEICPYVISDEHWFSENLLCLLSNAVKYSDAKSIVDVRIGLVSGDSLRMLTDESQCLLTEGSEKSNSADSANHSYLNSKIIGIGEDIIRKSNDMLLDDGDETKSEEKKINASEERITLTGSAKSFANESPINYPYFIRVSIEDRGVGLSEEDRQNLFRPFKQAQRMAGGTGLGLYSLSKRLEALHGYCGVDARSDGENGSVFWFAFPYRPDPAHMNLKPLKRLSRLISFAASISQSVVLDQKSKNISLRVLVVDDSASILKITSRRLISKGHYVEEAKDGSQGLQHLKNSLMTGNIDVLLTDLQMPIMDGYTFVKRFRKYEDEILGKREDGLSSLRKLNNRQGRVLIIGMSANSDNDSKQDALDAGMDNFISKPFNYDKFWDAVIPFLPSVPSIDAEKVTDNTSSASSASALHTAVMESIESRCETYSATTTAASSFRNSTEDYILLQKND